MRGGDGVFRVLEDNLRVPSGVAYMLENRQISKRVFADAFRSLDIQPVDGYPTRLQEMLASLTPRPGELPVIAVLTPGIHNSAYFEHAFLASQMGALLVEGNDLVVGDDDVCRVRTVGGLVQVDVIYRRVDDLFLDPEVFLPDSLLGVPGLMRSWRSGKVALANAPGAGVADDKVVYAYVPALIRYYLDEEPLLASVPTYVCLDDDDRRYVLDHLAELVVKPANESGGMGIYIGTHATAEETEAIRLAVQADPRNWIAQPIVELSTAPTLVRRSAVAPPHRPAAVHPLGRPALRHQRRAHPRGAARGLAGGQQLPGRRQQGHLDHRSRRGRRRRCPADPAAVRRRSPSRAPARRCRHERAPGRRRPPRRGRARAIVPLPGAMLLSRVAEHIYWAGRYLERAEGTARLVKTHTELFVDLPRSVGLGWAPLLAVTGSREAFDDGYDRVTEDDVVGFLLAAPENHGSVITSIEQARENLRVTRGLLPKRMWEVVNETRQWVQVSAVAGCARGSRMMWTEEVIRRCHTMMGTADSTMSRDLAYAFLEVGRLVERADMTSRVLDVQAGILMSAGADTPIPYTDLTWMAMLRSLGGEQMYRRQMGGVISAANTVQFLLRDSAFPRSVEYCLIEIMRLLPELPHNGGALDAAITSYRLLDAVAPGEVDLDGIHRFVDDLQVALSGLHGQLAATYFPGTGTEAASP